MLRRALILAVTALLLAGCASYPDTTKQRMESLPQHYSQFDLVIGWETKVQGGKTLIDGIVKNVRYAYMYDLEIWVGVLDPSGKVHSRAVGFVIPRQLNYDQLANFSVELPVAVEPGSRLRFTYQYRGSEGGDDGNGGMERGPNWLQSFDAVVPAM
jgi:hypothetical protein